MYSWTEREVFNEACDVRYEDDWERVSIESSRNAEDTTRGALKLFHQSPIIAGRFTDDNIKENSLKHKSNTQQKTKTDKIMDIKYSSELTLSSFFIFLFSYSSRATLTRSLIPLKPLYILSRNMNSVERLVIIQLVTGTPAVGLNSKLQL